LARPLLKYIQPIKKNGKWHYYFRRNGFARVKLPGLPGSAEFMAAYQTALGGVTAPPIEIGAACSKPGSVAAAVATYLGSIDFSNLAYATRRDRRLILERFREKHGEIHFAGLRQRHVEAMLAAKAATPHAGKGFLKALRGVIAVGMRAGLCTADPTIGLKVKSPKTNGFLTWSEDEIARFEAHWPIGSRERLAFTLLLYTGQRRGDVIRLGRQHIRDGLIAVRQNKTGANVGIPIHPALKAIVDTSKTGQLTFLTTATGKPFAPGSFTNWFGRACREAGLPLGLSAHGLRKGMCRRLAEAGCSAKQIQAISGHATLKEVERYCVDAEQKRLAADAMEQIGIPGVNHRRPKV
jgi:integrase